MSLELGRVAKELGDASRVKDLRNGVPAVAPPGLAPSPAECRTKRNPDRIYDQCVDGVLVFASVQECPKCNRWHPQQVASGFIIREDGVAVTTPHVLEGASEEGTLLAMDHAGRTYGIKSIIALDATHDLAVLQVDGDGFRRLPLRCDAPPGAAVWVISHPRGRFFTFTGGIISRYYLRKIENTSVPAMAITAEFGRGSSGAPVLDEHGCVVGIADATAAISAGDHEDDSGYPQMIVRMCIPSSSLLEVLGVEAESRHVMKSTE